MRARRSHRVDVPTDAPLPQPPASTRSWLMVIAIAGLAFVGGCGERSSSASVADSPDTTGAPSATRVIEPGENDDRMLVEAGDVDVTEPCSDALGDAAAESASSLTVDELTDLESMLGVALRYGTEHPDQFGGYGLHRFDNGEAAVVASFVDDVEVHRTALGRLVEHADKLIVCQARATEADRHAISNTLTRELTGRYTSISTVGLSGALQVRLNATEELLAAELVERYGTAVDVFVGALRYPLETAKPVCSPRSEPGLPDGLELSIVEALPVSRSGDTMPIAVRLTNTNIEPIQFASGPATATITDSNGQPLSSDPRAAPLAGTTIALEPGSHEDLDIDVSLTSCEPSNGYVLPPGDYHIVVSLYYSPLQTDMHSEPLPVTIKD